MSTVEELQAEIVKKDALIQELTLTRDALTMALSDRGNEIVVWKQRAENCEKQIESMSHEDYERRILFERVEAERDAIVEVIKIQAGYNENPSYSVSLNTDAKPADPDGAV